MPINSSASITHTSKLNGPERRRSSTNSEHYTFEAHDVGARCRHSSAGALQSRRWRKREEGVGSFEHPKLISVRQLHPDDEACCLPEIDGFTFPPPSGRIMQEERKEKGGPSGDRERREGEELNFLTILVER